MNNGNFESKDPQELQQMIIFLQAEVAKYKDSDYGSLLDLLEQDNVQLMNDKNELSKELSSLQEEYKKLKIESQERMNLHELQINKQPVKAVKSSKYEFTTNRQKKDPSLQSMLVGYKTTIEKLENKLVALIHEENKQVHVKIEKLEKISQDHNRSKQVEERLLKELEEKNSTLKKLRQDLLDLKVRSDKQNETITMQKKCLDQKKESIDRIEPITTLNKTTINAETLEQLDKQIKKILTESLEYEEKLNDKLTILNNFERKIDQLTLKINE